MLIPYKKKDKHGRSGARLTENRKTLSVVHFHILTLRRVGLSESILSRGMAVTPVPPSGPSTYRVEISRRSGSPHPFSSHAGPVSQ